MSFFDEEQRKKWKKEWQGMPEFVQQDKRSIKKITIHFESLEEIEDFAKLIDRKITKKTKYIWASEIFSNIENRKKNKQVYKRIKK